MKNGYLLFICMLGSYHVCYSQDLPDAKTILQRVKEKIASVKSMHYQSEYINFNAGLDDSISISKGSIWLKAVPTDTIFNTHFHVAYERANHISDYYYDGQTAIDISHRHSKKELEKKITMIEPKLLGNGMNKVQSRMSVLPYFNELMNMNALTKWLSRDSIQVREDRDGKAWILEWKEDVPAENFYATRQLHIDKEKYLITEMHRKSTWNGTRLGTDLYIRNIRINKEEDMDHVSLKQSYPDYVTTYDKNVAKNITAIASISLAGKKASPFNYTSFSGQPVSLKAEKGKLILLDFWETWCGYCYLAMPRLKELQQKYKDQGLEIIGIVSENRKGVQQVLETQQFPYPTIYVDEKMLANYKVEARPTYFLIDDTGTIVEHSIGSLDKIESAIKDWYKSK